MHHDWQISGVGRTLIIIHTQGNFTECFYVQRCFKDQAVTDNCYMCFLYMKYHKEVLFLIRKSYHFFQKGTIVIGVVAVTKEKST